MENKKIKHEVVELISKQFKNTGFDTDFIEYLDLMDDLRMDSITFISIVVEIEEHFDIEISNELLLMENFKSIDNIVQIIEQELANNMDETEIIPNADA